LLSAYEGKLRGEGAWLDAVRQQRDALLGLLGASADDVPADDPPAAAPAPARGPGPATPQSMLTGVTGVAPGSAHSSASTASTSTASPSGASVTFSISAAASPVTAPTTPAAPAAAVAVAKEITPDVALRVVKLDATLQRRIAEQEDQIKVLLRQRDSLSMTKSSLAAKIDILEGQRQTDKQMFTWLTEERDRLIEERSDAERRITEVESMVSQRGGTAAALAEQSERVAALEATVLSLNRTLKNVRDEAAMAEERIDELTSQLQAAEARVAALQARVDAGDAAEVDLRAAAAWEETRRAVAEAALQAAKADFAVALAARDAQHAEAKAAVAETAVHFSKLEALLHEADDNDRALRAEIDRMAEEHAAAQAAAGAGLREAQAEAARLLQLLHGASSIEEKTT
jgi:DNA repair exonuclease SbcCD ATPase subunit